MTVVEDMGYPLTMSKKVEKVPVNPDVLAWARKSAGLSLEEAARKLSPKTNPRKITDFELGTDAPTQSQFRKLAHAYRRPTALFFLSKPPSDFQPMHDFRRNMLDPSYSPFLLREIRYAHERRNLALEMYQDLDSKPPKFEHPADLNDSPDVVGGRIREILRITIQEQTDGVVRRDPFKFWRRRIEAAGVLVFQAGDIPLEEMLGFSLAMPTLPIITVNRKNKRGRVFTLLHEFTHLMLRLSGVCDIDENASRAPAEQKVEVFCNAVAGAALLPSEDFLLNPAVSANFGPTWRRDELDALARQYGVSALVVLRRLLILKKTTETVYKEVAEEYLTIYARLEKEEKDRNAQGEMRRNIPSEAIGKLGPPFIRLVLDNYNGGNFTLNDVSSFLGVKFRHLPKIIESLR